MRLPFLVAQDLVETGMLDSLATALAHGIVAVEQSFEDHPWIWIGAIAVCLIFLLRPKS